MSRSCRSCVTLLLKTSTAVFRELKDALDATLVAIRVPNYVKISEYWEIRIREGMQLLGALKKQTKLSLRA